uniref:Uncharacterized protein n=1 Tax=Oryza meridionalis TaxID=40149 RepID=A0A0E0E068_9ORYZ
MALSGVQIEKAKPAAVEQSSSLLLPTEKKMTKADLVSAVMSEEATAPELQSQLSHEQLSASNQEQGSVGDLSHLEGQRADVHADDHAGLRQGKVTPSRRRSGQASSVPLILLMLPSPIATRGRSQIRRCAVSVHELPPRLTLSEQATLPV